MHPHPHPHPHTQALISPLLSSLSQHTHTNTQAHKCLALAARCFPLNTPLTPKEEEKEKGREYSTQPSSHAAQAHHTPLHAINNENKAGKTKKKKKRTGVGNEEMPLVIHMLFLFIFCSFLIHILFFSTPTPFSLSCLAFILFFILSTFLFFIQCP